ncbi:uncharacterized protein LOC142566300 [Dermacentor variabilis]|uniref:uncharacterized protein LOC142566300 n=1 Tax=Dermacentor variabilis TaxID=34621 RepID=UPI003F5CB455
MEILLCYATDFTDAPRTGLANSTTDHRRLQYATQLTSDIIMYGLAHAYGTTTAPAPAVKTECAGYLRAVGTEVFRGHGESITMKPTELRVLYLQAWTSSPVSSRTFHVIPSVSDTAAEMEPVTVGPAAHIATELLKWVPKEEAAKDTKPVSRQASD